MTEKVPELRTRFRFSWVYWTKPDCGTPNFYTDSRAEDGNHFKSMKSYCKRVFDEVMESDLCPDRPVEGGACVILYEKRDLSISKETPYILTKDKRGYKIAFKLDSKGKKRRIKYKLAQEYIKNTIKGRKRRARKLTQKVVNMHEIGDGCSRNIHGRQ